MTKTTSILASKSSFCRYLYVDLKVQKVFENHLKDVQHISVTVTRNMENLSYFVWTRQFSENDLLPPEDARKKCSTILTEVYGL